MKVRFHFWTTLRSAILVSAYGTEPIRLRRFLVGHSPEHLHLQPFEVCSAHRAPALRRPDHHPEHQLRGHPLYPDFGKDLLATTPPTNGRSRRLVVRITRLWFAGIRRWEVHASKSSQVQATELESDLPNSASRPSANSSVIAHEATCVRALDSGQGSSIPCKRGCASCAQRTAEAPIKKCRS